MPDYSEPQVIAEINYRGGYAALVNAFRARAQERKIAITSSSVAAMANLPEYYIPKLLAVHPVRRIGMISLGPLLGVLGMKLLAVPDDEAVARYSGKLDERRESCVHNGAAITFKFSRRHMQKMGKNGAKVRWSDGQRRLRAARVKGGTNSRKNMTRQQASALARKAIQARWARVAAKAPAQAKAA